MSCASAERTADTWARSCATLASYLRDGRVVSDLGRVFVGLGDQVPLAELRSGAGGSRRPSTTPTRDLAVCALATASAAREFSRSARVFSTTARWFSTEAFAASTCALAWLTLASKGSGSMRAMIWFFFTWELKSAWSSLT